MLWSKQAKLNLERSEILTVKHPPTGGEDVLAGLVLMPCHADEAQA